MSLKCQKRIQPLCYQHVVGVDIDRRGMKRYTTPLTVIIGNTPYVPTNWSLGGIRINDYRGLLELETMIDVRVIIANNANHKFFRTSAKIIRSQNDNESLVLAFTALDALAKSCLRQYSAQAA